MANASRVHHLYDCAASRYDAVTSTRILKDRRAGLLAGARGDVLELGVGTGATFPHSPRNLRSLTALDLRSAMLHGAHLKAPALPFAVHLVPGDFQTLPFEDAHFDTVVSSLGLCGIPDSACLFSEVRRVLRPGGQLLALEHVRPPNRWLGALADAIDPAFDHFVGCHPNRPTADLLREAGFQVEVLDQRLGGILLTLSARPALPGVGGAT